MHTLLLAIVSWKPSWPIAVNRSLNGGRELELGREYRVPEFAERERG